MSLTGQRLRENHRFCRSVEIIANIRFVTRRIAKPDIVTFIMNQALTTLIDQVSSAKQHRQAGLEVYRVSPKQIR